MAYTVPQQPGGHMTPKSTRLSGPGGYTTNTPTLSPGAGVLKAFGAGTANVRKAGTEVVNRTFQGGKSGSNSYTSAALKNTKRVIVP